MFDSARPKRGSLLAGCALLAAVPTAVRAESARQGLGVSATVVESCRAALPVGSASLPPRIDLACGRFAPPHRIVREPARAGPRGKACGGCRDTDYLTVIF